MKKVKRAFKSAKTRAVSNGWYIHCQTFGPAINDKIQVKTFGPATCRAKALTLSIEHFASGQYDLVKVGQLAFVRDSFNLC